MAKIDFNAQIMNAASFAERLKYLMKFRNLSGQQVADCIGISKPTISTMTTGKTTNINASTILKLGHLLQVDPEWLLTGEGNPERKTYLPSEREETAFDDASKLMRFSLDEYGFTLIKSLARGDKPVSLISVSLLKECKVLAKNCVCYTSFGDEMEPIIKDGEKIVVHTKGSEIKNGKIYALAYGDSSIFCRRLYKKVTSDEITMTGAERDSYVESFYLGQNSIKILGQVIAIKDRIIEL